MHTRILGVLSALFVILLIVLHHLAEICMGSECILEYQNPFGTNVLPDTLHAICIECVEATCYQVFFRLLLCIFVILLIIFDFLLLLLGGTVILFGTSCGQNVDLCFTLLASYTNEFLFVVI